MSFNKKDLMECAYGALAQRRAGYRGPGMAFPGWTTALGINSARKNRKRFSRPDISGGVKGRAAED
jgi:hypothetical protein